MQNSGIGYFIYVLSENSEYFFETSDGNKVKPTYKNFRSLLDYEEPSEWSLSTGFLKVGKGDWIWAYFASPDKRIGAVGTVVDDPYWNKEWGGWAVSIKWDSKKTDRLEKSPIFYRDYKQQVQASVNEANKKTRRVFNHWLGDLKPSDKEDKQARTLKKVWREINQRLGQREFRAKLISKRSLCPVTEEKTHQVLEAAHIRPVSDGGTHTLDNGLLLRADIHHLFDRGLIWVDDNDLVRVDDQLKSTEYKKYDGKDLDLPGEKPLTKKLKRNLRYHRELHNR